MIPNKYSGVHEVPGIGFAVDVNQRALRFCRGIGWVLYYTNAYSGKVAKDHATTEAGIRRRYASLADTHFGKLMAPWYIAPCIGEDWYVCVTYRSGVFQAANAYSHGRDYVIPDSVFVKVSP